MSYEFSTTRGGDRIVFGAGTLATIGQELDALGARRVLVVSTAGRADMAQRVAGLLRGRCAGLLAIAEPHVPAALAAKASRETRRLDADWIVAVGGGSSVGLAKAVALDQQVRVAAVPTTYSGSEMTDIYGLTEGDRKRTGRDARVRPALVIYDVALTLDLPVDLSCTSAFNAMAHAIEALYAHGADPLTQIAAEETIRAIARHLPGLLAAPRDLDVRSALFYGAHLAAACLAAASMGLHHKLCHVLGGSFGMPHAATHTVILPHVVDFQHEAAAGAIARVAWALGVPAGSHAAAHAAAALHDLAVHVGAPTSLQALGLAYGDLDRAADLAVETPYRSPRPVDRAAVRALLEAAYHGHRTEPPAATVPSASTREASTAAATASSASLSAGTVSASPAAATASSASLGAASPAAATAPSASTPSASLATTTSAGEPMVTSDEFPYLAGFAREMQSEALPGALPRTQNSPRPAPYGLYCEGINGTAFTVRRAENRRTWLYRIRPSLVQSRLEPVPQQRIIGRFDAAITAPNLTRWRPVPLPPAEQPVDFVDGLATLAGAGDPDLRTGLAIHLYAANADMRDRCFYDADGDLLLVPELGALHIRTELGWLRVRPGELAIMPRGLKFSVELPDGVGRGVVLELFGQGFRLPERGPIGANGLADERHFLSPVAAYEDRACPGYEVMAKHGGQLFRATLGHVPYDVVAWHGNHVPCKYDLAHFNTMGSVSFDHPDPSILTVLTCPLGDHGNNLADVIVFPGRWEVAEHTFRPPYYHRNVATEFNYIVSMPAPNAGFDRGVHFLTPSMTPHGIAARAHRSALVAPDTPRRLSDESLWIMFETALGLRLTAWAMASGNRDDTYHDLSADMPATFCPPGVAPAANDPREPA
jgi:homogentisate 1,2-dioxygenase